MAHALGFPEVEHEQLPGAPLRAMLGQIQFAPIPRIADMAGIAPFQEAIAASFPDFSPEQQMSVVLGPDGRDAVRDDPELAFLNDGSGLERGLESWSADA